MGKMELPIFCWEYGLHALGFISKKHENWNGVKIWARHAASLQHWDKKICAAGNENKTPSSFMMVIVDLAIV